MSAWTDLIESDMGLANDYNTLAGGSPVPGSTGGTGYITSSDQWKALNAQWQNPPPYAPRAFPDNFYYQRYDGNGNEVRGGIHSYSSNAGAIAMWAWVFAGPGHPANSNTALEVRNLSTAVLRKSTNQWQELYTGGRCFGIWWEGQTWLGDQPGSAGNQSLLRFPDSTYCKPEGNYGYEMWARPSASYPNVVEFDGASNPTAVQDALCYFGACQIRLIVDNPSLPDDRNSAVFIARLGFDLHTTQNSRGRHYDWLGYPLDMMSGTNSRWKRIYNTNDWTWITFCTVNQLMYEPVKTQPPWGAYGAYEDPYAATGVGSISRAQFLANPPPIPTGFASVEPDPPPTTLPPIIVRPSVGTWFAKLDAGLNNWSTASSVPTPPTSLSTEEEDNEMLIQRNAATGAQRTIIFRAVDATDGYTAETGLSFGAGDIKISKNGAAEANHAGTVTEIAGGMYKYEFALAELDTPGAISFRTNKSGVRPASSVHQVVAFNPYDDSALGLTRIDATVSSRLASASYENVDAFLDKTDAIETGITPRRLYRLIGSVLGAKLSGAGTGTESFRNAVADSKTRVVATVDTSGNRTAITYDLT